MTAQEQDPQPAKREPAKGRRRSASEREGKLRAQRIGAARKQARDRKRAHEMQAQDAKRKTQTAGTRAAAAPAAPRGAFRRESILIPGGSPVTVAFRGFSLRGLEHQQERAARRFALDWEIAYRELQCRGFERGVDCSPAPEMHLARVQAQQRLRGLRTALGAYEFDLLRVVVVCGATIEELAKATGLRNPTVSYQVRRTLNNAANFYSGVSVAIDPLRKEMDRIIREGLAKG